MAAFDYQITEADIGRALDPADGFLTDLSMTTPPQHQTPTWDEGKRIWLSGYFVLRGSNERRDLYCADIRNGGLFSWLGREGRAIINGSFSYRGSLVVVAVPKASVWSLTLSDQPIIRAPRPVYNDGVAFGGYVPHHSPAAPREREREPMPVGR